MTTEHRIKTGGPQIDSAIAKKSTLLALFLVFLILLFLFPQSIFAAEKKSRRAQVVARPTTVSVPSAPAINDANIEEQFKAAQDLAKRGKADEALRVFQGIYDYTRDALALVKCVNAAYDKGASGQALDQSQKEDLYLKLERIKELTSRYTMLKAESAFQVGAIHAKKGNGELAKKYLLEVCQTAPFSLAPSSIWMRSKNLLLGLFGLEGEF